MEFQIDHIGNVRDAKIELEGISVIAGKNDTGKSTIVKGAFIILDIFSNLERDINLQEKRSINSYINKWSENFHIYIPNVSIRTLLRRLFFEDNLQKDTFEKELCERIGEHNIDEKAVRFLYDCYSEFHRQNRKDFETYAVQTGIREIYGEQVETIGYREQCGFYLKKDDESAKILLKENRVCESKCDITDHIIPIYISTSDLVDLLTNNTNISSGTISIQSRARRKLVNFMRTELERTTLPMEEDKRLDLQKTIFQEIIEDVLRGKIQSDGKKLQYFDERYHQKIDFGNIASGMRIFLILQRLIENGTFLKKTCLFIDEPESNLHPEWQLILADCLVNLYYKLGINICINSHSPYFIRAVEYYSFKSNDLNNCHFYLMESCEEKDLYYAKDVTDDLGQIYDYLSKPFNEIM